MVIKTTFITLEFQGKRCEIALGQLRTIDKRRFISEPGNVN